RLQVPIEGLSQELVLCDEHRDNHLDQKSTEKVEASHPKEARRCVPDKPMVRQAALGRDRTNLHTSVKARPCRTANALNRNHKHHICGAAGNQTSQCRQRPPSPGWFSVRSRTT